MKLFSRRKIWTWLLLLSPSLYIGSCVYFSGNLSAKFERINIGDTKSVLINVFGSPSHIERSDFLFSRYADKKCQNPCVERLWYENRMAMDIEAWSFEIDKDNLVTKKYHWVSP
jgi:hypothetical protein